MGSRLVGAWPDIERLHGAAWPQDSTGHDKHPVQFRTPPAPIADVAVIDDDDALRLRLGALFTSVGLRALLLAGPNEAIEDGRIAAVRCLLMDVRMRGANGLDVQERLLGLGIGTPVVFMTAHGDIPMSVRAMKAGAVDFLTKPLREQDVLEAVEAALERDHHERQRVRGLLALQTRLAALSRREYEVLHFVSRGLMNKQIAAELGLSEVTVKMHRSSLMRKMGARTAAELSRMATALEVGVPAPPQHHRQAHAPVFIPVQDALETDRGVR